MGNKLLISVITVCYNSEKTIRDTIESVLNQTYSNIEYILIDGNSIDNTVDTIKLYENKFKEQNITYNWISEDDKGISDAFNKGAKLASGDYVIFLNSGDYFYEKNILKDLFQDCKEDFDIVTGKVKIIGKNKQMPKNVKTSMMKGMPAHQATFISKGIYKKIKYDLTYKIRMDYDYFLNVLRNKTNLKIKFVEKKVSFYGIDGISSNNYFDFHKEGFKISKKYNVKYNYSHLFKDTIKFILGFN